MEINWDNLLTSKFIENVDVTRENIFCDVGACLGTFTKLFKNLSGEKGIVYSFELNSFNYNSIKHLASDRCICENLAVSDLMGFVDFYADNINPGNHISNIIGHDTSFRKMNFISQIKSVSLDEYFKDKTVDYIKIDVEGAELKVLKGGLKTISNCKYAIIECHFDEDWEEMFSILKDNNLNFKNLVTDESVYFKQGTEIIPGRSGNGRSYQMYLKQ